MENMKIPRNKSIIEPLNDDLWRLRRLMEENNISNGWEWKVTTHTSRETYFIFIYFLLFDQLTKTTVFVFCGLQTKTKMEICIRKTKSNRLIRLTYSLVWSRFGF